MKFQRPKGTKDILPREMHKWHFVERTIREVMSMYNFSEIRTPAFENTGLFARGIGAETDVVGKEMYTFEDKGGNSLTLRPEGTAPVIRAYLENGMPAESPIQKLYYITNMYRYEKPQAGRYREHSQFGGEILGSDDVGSDVEIISLARQVCIKCGIKDFKVKINSIGKPEERRKYIELLRNYLQEYINELSDDSKRRFDTNPLRILDSKDKNDIRILGDAPKILDNISSESRKRFEKVLKGLEEINIKHEIDFKLVRGFDYYTDTTFEFISENLGAQDAIVGGGRYDGLVELLGGKPTPGVGFGCGIERLMTVAERSSFNFSPEGLLSIYLIPLTEDARVLSSKLCHELRINDISCETDLLGRSLKSQMREANKLNAGFVFIIGESEMQKGKGILKKMSDGSQSEIPFSELKNNFVRTA